MPLGRAHSDRGSGKPAAPKSTGFKAPFINYGETPKAAIGKGSPGYGVLKSSPAARTNRTSTPQSNTPPTNNYSPPADYPAPTPPAPAEPPAPQISDADFLNSDPNVIAQRAAYSKAFEQLAAELDLQKGQYEQDYGTSLKNLGWLQDAKDGQGDWDLNNTATSSGRGFQGLQNDYASRGMLQGSGYAEGLENFLKSLGQQKEQLGTSRSNFLADNNLKRTQGQQTRDEQIRLAEAAALANRAGLLTSISGLV